MPVNTIDAYLDAFKEGGARQYLFQVIFTMPADVVPERPDLTPYYVRTSSLPESSYEDVTVPYPGYSFKMAGNRTYADWTVSLTVDKEASILQQFQDWQNLIYNPRTHVYTGATTYMQNQMLQLLGPDLYPTKTYTLYRAWPKVLGNIQLDYASTELVTMDITFAYQYYAEGV